MFDTILGTILLVFFAPIAILAVLVLAIPSLVFTSLWNAVAPLLNIGLPQLSLIQGFACMGIACLSLGLVKGFVKFASNPAKFKSELSSAFADLKKELQEDFRDIVHTFQAAFHKAPVLEGIPKINPGTPNGYQRAVKMFVHEKRNQLKKKNT